MIRIIVDDELKQKLLSANGVVELCDSKGRSLGKLFPESASVLKEWEQISPPLSEDELQRRLESDKPGISTKELKARLADLS